MGGVCVRCRPPKIKLPPCDTPTTSSKRRQRQSRERRYSGESDRVAETKSCRGNPTSKGRGREQAKEASLGDPGPLKGHIAPCCRSSQCSVTLTTPASDQPVAVWLLAAVKNGVDVVQPVWGLCSVAHVSTLPPPILGRPTPLSKMGNSQSSSNDKNCPSKCCWATTPKLIDEDEWIDFSSKKKKRRKSGRKSVTKATKDLHPMPPLHEVRGIREAKSIPRVFSFLTAILFRRKQLLSKPSMRTTSSSRVPPRRPSYRLMGRPRRVPGLRQGARLI